MTKRFAVRAAAFAACLALLLGLGSPQRCPADETKKADDTPITVTPAATDVENIGTAYELADYGRKNKSPESLIVAARMLRKIRTLPLAEKPTIAIDKDAPKEDKGKAPSSEPVSLIAQSDNLLAEARKMAPDDKLIAELADRVAREKTRAALGGPRSSTNLVRARHSQNWGINFRGRELATVSVVGDGRTALEVRIANEKGMVVREHIGPQSTLSWVPQRTQRFIITVHNRGPGPNVYTLYTN